MTNNRAKALEAVEFCLSVIGNPRIPKEDTAIWSCGTSSKPRITMDILETIRDALSEPRQLTTIAAILQRWIDFDTDARNKEGLETTDATHIMAPPTWPSHGQLKNWIAALSEPKWKSMDSAPRDTRILTYYHGEIAILNKQLALKNSKTVCHKWHYDDGDEACTPQKWMPLPSPPTGD